ncbi:unnamed protein product [Schistocephalus solidus]|uniref:Dynein light chain n=1 Tax=Schistocephalus solidus TaxID=70667 RepID=A0A183TF22_SCHSO|nr:unnamed protein product [Schistocephalus solidus]
MVFRISHDSRREGSEVRPLPEVLLAEGKKLPANCCWDGLQVLKDDLPEKEEHCALEKLRRLLNKYTLEKEIAQKLKKRMEKVFEGHWSCIVGSSFGCFVSHVEHEYLHVRSGRKEILLYRSA